MGNPMNGFFYGFFYPFRCISFFFKHPKIILLSILPVIINFAIYLFLFIYLYKKVTDNLPFHDNAIAQFQFLQEFVNALISIIGFVAVLALCFLGFIFLGGILGAPFNDRISIEVEKIYNLKTVETLHATSAFYHERVETQNFASQPPERSFLKEALLSIKAEIQKLLFYLCVIIPLFFIGFIPAAGEIISISIGTFFSFFYNALEFLDYPMSRRNLTFRKRLNTVQSGGMLTYGFGCICFLFMFIPFLNVFLKPLLVVSGTDLYLKKYVK